MNLPTDLADQPWIGTTKRTWGFKKTNKDDIRKEYTRGKPAPDEHQIVLFTVFLRLSYSLRLYNWQQLESNYVMCKGITCLPATPQKIARYCEQWESFSHSMHYAISVGWTSKIEDTTRNTKSRALRTETDKHGTSSCYILINLPNLPVLLHRGNVTKACSLRLP